MDKKFILHILALAVLYGITASAPAHSQVLFTHASEIKVFENGNELKFPFAGGLNSGQYGTIDFNQDGLQDLVVFDRSADKLITFANTGNSYVYAPEFEHSFPENIQNWMVLADYNCDGKKDIFTYTNLGIRVFRNTNQSTLEWELVADPVFTKGSSSQVNISVNTTDIPAIADLDGDGDLDILVYNFASGGFIHFHKNISIETTGHCNNLDFERVTRQYGDFEECTCDEFVFSGDPCSANGRILHAGGKSILAFDNDGDGDLELVIGQEECSDMNIFTNEGTPTEAAFTSYNNLFPEQGQAIDMQRFPTPYYVDVTFDGLKDIIVAPNLRANPDGLIDNRLTSWLFKNTGTPTMPNFRFEGQDFLQTDMIDVGEYAYPTFADIDGDFDEDLLVAGTGQQSGGLFHSSLWLYEKTPQGFVLADKDFSSLSQLNFTYLNVSVQYLNADNLPDMIVSGIGPGNDTGLYYIPGTSVNGKTVFQPNQMVKMVSTISAFDDPEFCDVNGDGALDLLLGKQNGKLEYYVNTRTNDSPSFQLENGAYLGLDFNGAKGNLNITAKDIDRDGTTDLITTDRSGIMSIYLDFTTPGSQPESDILKIDDSEQKHTTVFGRSNHPAIGIVDGKTVLAVGNIRGGFSMMELSGSLVDNGGELELTVFPNPSRIDKVVKFHTPSEGVELEIFGVAGNRMVGPLKMNANQTLQLDLSIYQTGLYLARIRKGSSTQTRKFILGNSLDNL